MGKIGILSNFDFVVPLPHGRLGGAIHGVARGENFQSTIGPKHPPAIIVKRLGLLSWPFF
ncbi:hypothetical protein [Streptococcus porci]|uniref:hypothetical protein n=1 Tax=Streptococcus porci TaxID=502567 RepID=UPI0003F798D4|nr:hypothetical protein [Streptococcus porci]